RLRAPSGNRRQEKSRGDQHPLSHGPLAATSGRGIGAHARPRRASGEDERRLQRTWLYGSLLGSSQHRVVCFESFTLQEESKSINELVKSAVRRLFPFCR